MRSTRHQVVVLAALINALHALRAALESRRSGSAIVSAVWHTEDVSQQGRPLVSQAVQPARASIQRQKASHQTVFELDRWKAGQHDRPGPGMQVMMPCPRRHAIAEIRRCIAMAGVHLLIVCRGSWVKSGGCTCHPAGACQLLCTCLLRRSDPCLPQFSNKAAP